MSTLHKTASWVIIDKGTGEVILETFNIEFVNKIDKAQYNAIPILEYLGSINGKKKK